MPIYINYNVHEYDLPIIDHTLQNLLTIKNSCGCNLSICVLCKTTFHNNIFRMIYYTRHIDQKYHLQCLCYMTQYISQHRNYLTIYNRLLNSIFNEIFSQYNKNYNGIDPELRKVIIHILLKIYIPYFKNDYTISALITQ